MKRRGKGRVQDEARSQETRNNTDGYVVVRNGSASKGAMDPKPEKRGHQAKSWRPSKSGNPWFMDPLFQDGPPQQQQSTNTSTDISKKPRGEGGVAHEQQASSSSGTKTPLRTDTPTHVPKSTPMCNCTKAASDVVSPETHGSTVKEWQCKTHCVCGVFATTGGPDTRYSDAATQYDLDDLRIELDPRDGFRYGAFDRTKSLPDLGPPEWKGEKMEKGFRGFGRKTGCSYTDDIGWSGNRIR